MVKILLYATQEIKPIDYFHEIIILFQHNFSYQTLISEQRSSFHYREINVIIILKYLLFIQQINKLLKFIIR